MKLATIADLKVGDVFEIRKRQSPYGTYIYLPTSTALQVTSMDAPYGGCSYFPIAGNRARLNLLPYDHFEYAKDQTCFVYDEKDKANVVPLVKGLTARWNQMTGADPEIFVVRGKETETLLPAFNFLPKKTTNMWSVAYWDGFAAEYAPEPKGCHGYFVDNLRHGLQTISSAAKKFDRTAKLTIKNSFLIPDAIMERASEEQTALGCLPSTNAYGDSPELPSGRDLHLRFAGGHIHFGMSTKTKEEYTKLVKGCDLILGVPAVAIFASIDTPTRRQFYGRAGEYRTPTHGLEYRVLSNAWLCNPKIAHLILQLGRAALKVGGAGFADKLGLTEDRVQAIINYCDVKEARKWTLANLDLLNILICNDGGANNPKALKAVLEGGVEAIAPNYVDIEGNWKLNGSWDRHSNASLEIWGAARPA